MNYADCHSKTFGNKTTRQRKLEMEPYLLSESCTQVQTDSKDQELFTRDALGAILSELFVKFTSLHGIPKHCSAEKFSLFSVFVKDSSNCLSYVGHLGSKGGILLRDGDLTTSLRPHLHRSIKQCVDQYLTAKKHPFTRKITEFAAKKLAQNERPEGKWFSWIDMGMSQIHYVDPVKLSAKLGDCFVDLSRPCLKKAEYLYIVHKNCISEKLDYYGSTPYQCTSWMGKDTDAIEAHIKHLTKSKPCVTYNCSEPRAFGLCKVSISKDGCLSSSDYNVHFIPSNPYEQCSNESVFIAEELDFDFVSETILLLKSMKTRETLQSALKDIYVNLTSFKERCEALRFLQEVIRKFQTEECQVIQMVDLSFAIPCIPSCLSSYPTLLSRVLRAAGIVVTESSSQDSDDEEKNEPQIVFQPANCQEYLRLIEYLLTILVKGVITDEQCETATQLLDHEVSSLQELFHTQMCCICSPWKSMNPKEEPMASLWKKGTRTKRFLESLGLVEEIIDEQKVVMCPEHSQLLNVLSIFYKDVE